ncbi:MAG: hypothetical protein J1F36_02095 [Clostridiales bacterium]|nr:hypothetical protein [Clostridiales bacterium]
MKKKNLAILLVMPFLIALFGIATIKTAFNLIDNDVIRINWTYKDNELFQVGAQFELKADGVVADSRYPASEGNRLVWMVENSDGAEQPHAETFTDGNDNWYLKTLSTGSVIISCTTEKRTITPISMNGIIYSGSAFVINTKVGGSGQVVDENIYYGEYDLNNGQKQPAVIDFDITVSEESLRNKIVLDTENTSSNLTVDLTSGKITINSAIEGMSSVVLKNTEHGMTTTFAFEVVKGGVNVYTYEDLLACTNNSQSGEIVVLRTNFESRANANSSTATNVAMFGTLNGGKFDFANEAYKFETTYNSEFIDQWNDPDNWKGDSKVPSGYKKIDKILYAGLHIQKDFYGNGYTLNLHNLCFPSSYTTMTGPAGEIYDYYKPGDGDLFRGPKPFYMLGDPNSSLPLVTAYGQDNVGLYIDGNNITLNDVKVKNCDFGLIIDNLDYAGTVVEVNGNGNTIKNSVMSNGKNILRSFSSKDLTINNCILSTSRNFLLSVGSNEYEKNSPLDSTRHTFTKLDGTTVTCTLSEYLSDEGDKILNLFNVGFSNLDELMGSGTSYTKEQMKKALHSLQEGLNRADAITADQIMGSTQVNDTIFYRSGIASIGVDTMFNGPFLYNNSPSMISAILGLFGSMLETAIPMFPDNVSGSAYPVTVNISGNTRFYDYKSLDEWDISGLIDQNISAIVNGLGLLDKELDITIDDIFPLKEILTNVARSNGCIYTVNEKDYINIPIAFYGGGRNLSSVTTNGLTSGGLTNVMNVDLLDSYLNMNTKLDLSGLENGNLSGILSDPSFMRFMKETLTKTVTTVTGFEAFKFQFGNNPEGLFDTETGTPMTPDYRDLTNKA